MGFDLGSYLLWLCLSLSVYSEFGFFQECVCLYVDVPGCIGIYLCLLMCLYALVIFFLSNVLNIEGVRHWVL